MTTQKTIRLDRPYITLFSTPQIASWVFDETRRILFDAGDGVVAHIEQRIAKIRKIALSHSHRDHISGLTQLLNLRGGAGDLSLIFPEDSGAILSYLKFLAGFDKNTSGKVDLIPVTPETDIIMDDERLILRPYINWHLELNDTKSSSLGYQIIRKVNKLKPEYEYYSQKELDAVRVELGRDALVAPKEKVIFAISGDTPPMDPKIYEDCDYLLHECTFLDMTDGEDFSALEHGHSVLDDVIEMAKIAKVGHLGLYHISKRYSEGYIRDRVISMCKEKEIDFPVSVAYPGKYIDDFFGNAIWFGGGDI